MKTLMLWLLAISFSCFALCAEAKTRTINLTARNTLVFDQQIDPLSVSTFIYAMIGKRALLPVDETMYILIVSGGGNYRASVDLTKAISQAPNTQVICKWCASGAGLVFAGSKLKRLAMDKSRMMMHEMYLPHFTVAMLTNDSLLLRFIEDNDTFNKALSGIMGIPQSTFEKKIRDTEWNVDGADLVKLKLADEFVKITCDAFMTSQAPNTCF